MTKLKKFVFEMWQAEDDIAQLRRMMEQLRPDEDPTMIQNAIAARQQTIDACRTEINRIRTRNAKRALDKAFEQPWGMQA